MSVINKKLLILIGLTLFSFFLSPLLGIEFISPISAFEQENFAVYIHLRLPRAIAGFTAGSILAIAGVIYQSCLQNSLASPYTLGISSAAALGVSISSWLNLNYYYFLGFSISSVMALICCLIVTFLLVLIGKNKSSSKLTLILFGLLLGFFISSLLLLLQYFFNYSKLLELTRWLTGSVSGLSIYESIIMLVISSIFLFSTLRRAKNLDYLALGELKAKSFGLNVSSELSYFLFISSVAVSISVAMFGPIGFVGIIVPHVARNLMGFSHSKVIIVAWLIGGNLLIWSDVLARVLLIPYELPIGLITSLVGVPVFTLIMLRNKLRSS